MFLRLQTMLSNYIPSKCSFCYYIPLIIRKGGAFNICFCFFQTNPSFWKKSPIHEISHTQEHPHLKQINLTTQVFPLFERQTFPLSKSVNFLQPIETVKKSWTCHQSVIPRFNPINTVKDKKGLVISSNQVLPKSPEAGYWSSGH